MQRDSKPSLASCKLRPKPLYINKSNVCHGGSDLTLHEGGEGCESSYMHNWWSSLKFVWLLKEREITGISKVGKNER